MFRPYMNVRPSYMPKYVPDASCVLWLPGQDDPQSATIRDRSGQGNDGTIVGATWVRLGSGLWVLNFPGDDNHVDCGTSATLTPSDITMEIWVKSTDAADSYICMFMTGGKVNLQGMYLYRNGAVDKDLVGLGVYGKSDAFVPTFAETLLNDGAWHHLVGTKSGDEFKVYLDTVLKDTDTIADVVITMGACYIGARIDRQQDFTGHLALARLYNRALNVGEILGHYQQERHLFNV